MEKGKKRVEEKKYNKTKAFEEISKEFAEEPRFKEIRPSLEPKDFDEIEY
ncbi:hypothetical protein RZN22_16755 [Bacillaceae bacterium S4-13-58]